MTDQKAVLGIIAGSGPEAGVDLWRKILVANRIALNERFRGDIDAPHMVIISEPTLGLSMDLVANREPVWASLCRCCEDIAPQVDYFAIACNTLHAYQSEIEALHLPAQFVSLVDTAVDFAQRRALSSLALLAADPVARLDEHSPYQRLANAVRVEVPRQSLQQLILDVKRLGPTPELSARFSSIVAGLESHTVLLACTELPLIAQPVAGKELVDVTDLLAERMARLSLATASERPATAARRQH
jgi:aspartate racemase